MKLFDRLRAQPHSSPAATTARPRLAMALEPRFLLDAAAVATGAEAAADQAAQDAAQQMAQAEHAAANAQANDAQADITAPPENADAPAVDAAAPPGERREIVFVDANVSDHQQLVANFSPAAEVVVLDPTRDGLLQIADYLRGQQGIDAVHVLSHGSAGNIALGSAQLNLGSLDGHRDTLGRIGEALTADGDLLFYGCNIAGSADGQALVRQLAQMTGADIAASTDETGRFAGRSDWELEYRSGDIDADIHALGDVDEYQYTLAPTSGNIHTYGAASWANSSLVTGADGNFYLAYKESSTAFTIKQWNGTSWNTLTTFTTTDTDDTVFGEKHDLAIDANGHLHLVFRHADGTGNANYRGISYGFFNGSSWSFSEVDEATHPTGGRNYDDPKLTVDADGNAHLIYRYKDSDTQLFYLRYATNAGGSWSVTDIDTTPIGTSITEIFVGDITIAAGNINIFYIREDNQNLYYGNVYHASKALAAGSWSASQKIIDAVAEGQNYYYTAFQTDAAGNSYIASSLANYDAEDNYLSSDLVLHTGTSGSWARSTIVNSTTNDNYVSGLQIVGDDKYLLVQSWPLDGSDGSLVMMADYGSGWITGDQVAPQFGTSELVMSVNASGQIMLVMEDGGLLNIGFTTGTEDDFGLIQGIPAPSAPDLAAGSDTGSSSTDNITSDTTPTFSGTATAGYTVHLFNDANDNGVLDAGEALGTVVATGGTWSITPTLAAGNYNIKAMAQNGSDYSAASAGLAVTIDSTGPAAPSAPDLAPGSDSGTYSTDNLTNDTTPTFTGSGAEPNALVRLYADGVEVGQILADASGNWTMTSSVLPEGSHIFTARVEDQAGNLGPASAGLSVTIDTTGPVVSMPDMTAATDSGSSSTDNLTNDTTPTFTGTAPAGTIVQLFIDNAGNGDAYDPLNENLGSATANGSGVWTLTPSAGFALVQGTWSVKARGRDDAGNFGAASAALTVTIDVTPPAAPAAPDLDAASDTGASNSDNITSDTTPTFSGTTTANTPVRLYANGVLVGSTTSDGSGNWSITSSTLSNGNYSITARVLDAAGNESADSSGLAVDIVNDTPTLDNLNGDSVAWPGVGSTVTLDTGGNALLGDSEFGALGGGAGDWSGATLTVTQADGAVGADVFGFDTAGASFTMSGTDLQAGGHTFATFTNTGGVLTITFTGTGTPATTALVSAVAQRITYRNDTPAGDATIRFSLSDGNSSGTADVTVTSDIIYVTSATDSATINRSNGVSFSEAIAIAAADSTGSQTIVFASNLAGQTITLAGNIALTESLTLNLDAVSNVILSGGTLTIGGGTTLTLINGAGDTAAFNTTLAGTGNLAKIGAGTLWLGSTSNNSGWSGGIAVTGGTLMADAGSRLSSGTLTLNGATLAMTVPGAAGTTTTVANAVVLGAGGGVIDIGGGGGANIAHFSGVISGGDLTKIGTAILQLSGNNTYTGTTTVEAGILVVGSDSDLGAGAVNLAAGTTLAVTGATTIDNAIALQGDATVDNSANATLAGIISGTANLTKAGAGTLTLSAVNTYTGTTTVSGGTLSIAGDGNLGGGELSLAGGSTLVVTSTATIDNAISLIGNASISASMTATLTGVVSGTGDLTKAGIGTLALSADNTYSGATTVSAGALRIADDGNLGSGSLSLASGAFLVVSDAATIDNDIAMTGDATIATAATVTLSGEISGSGDLIKAGVGVLTLAGTSGHSGNTLVNFGTLSIASDANLGTGALTLADGAALAITGATTVDNAIALSGTATVQTSADATLSGAISGAGSGLTKTGAAQLTLSGANTYTGTTTVAAGTLFISGSTAGATAVNGGAILAGTGSLGGAVTIGSGGTLSPGNGVGTLTVNGNLTLQAGSTLAMDISGTAAGTGYDQILVNGAVNVSGAVLAVTHGYAPGQGDTYTFIVNDAADAVTGTFSGLAEGGTVTAGGNGTALTASYVGGTGNDLTLTAPINQAPTVGSLDGDSRTFTQGGGAILLDNGDATVGDLDSADFDGGNITVAIVANGVAGEDVLGIRDEGTLAGQIGAAGGNVTYGGIIIGTYAGGSAGADLVITLNGAADAAATQALIRNLTYSNSNAANDIGQAARTVRITVNDGDGGTSANADVTVAVVETVAPSVVGLVVDDTALAASETTTVTITFSEAVSGVTDADFTVANGTLSGLSSIDGGITWTATLTPIAGVQDATNVITFNNGGVVDAAGNAGAGSTDSNNYAIDTLPPTASIEVTDTTLAIGEATTVTITFNEAVTGLTVADFTVANGALSGLSTSDGGVTWTATLTPTAGIHDATNVITFNNGDVVDMAGNAGMGSTDSNNYAIDTVRPTASIVVADAALKAGQTSQVTITFSEAVTGLAIDDFTVANGALTNLASADGITWTAMLIPAADVSDTTNAISLDNAGYADAAGNAGSGSTASNNYAIETVRPTAAIVVNRATLAIGQTATVTITFSEAVTGLAVDDFTVAGGMLSNLASANGGLTWTATLTPAGDITSTANVITLDNGGVQNGAGNAGAGATESNAFAIDTAAPTATVTTGPGRFIVTFSEVVTGIDASAFALIRSGGALGEIGSIQTVDGRTYIIELAGLSGDGALALALSPQAAIADLAGNAMTAPIAGGASYTVASDFPPPLLPETPRSGAGDLYLPPPVQPSTLPVSLTAVEAPTLLTPTPSISGSVFTPFAANSMLAPIANGYASELASADTAQPAIALGAGSDAGFIVLGSGAAGGLRAQPDLGIRAFTTTEAFSWSLPRGTFTHSDRGAVITVEARLADGRPLPAWLRFDPAKGTLSGKPPAGFDQKLVIEIVGRDNKGNRASTQLELDIRMGHLPQASADSDTTRIDRLATLLRAGPDPETIADAFAMAAPGFAAQLEAAANGAEREAAQLEAALDRHLSGA